MSVRVVDASALAGALLDSPNYAEVLDLLEDEEVEVAVPHLVDVEVLSVLRSVSRRGEVDSERVLRALALFRALPLRRFDHADLLERAFALRENFSAYDAVYVALAEGLAAPLLTGDARLARAVRTRTGVEVTEVG